MGTGGYSGLFLGSTPMGAVIRDLTAVIAQEYKTGDPALEAALRDTIGYWMESGQADIAGLANNVKNIIEVTGEAANNIMWYLLKIEFREGRVII